MIARAIRTASITSRLPVSRRSWPGIDGASTTFSPAL